MSSAKKKAETLCNKCAKKSDCDYKLKEDTLVLVRCLDFAAVDSANTKD